MGAKKQQQTGKNYFGSFSQGLGIGPATRLTRITNGETEIWSGDLDQSSRDGDGKTILSTTIGVIRWYWGRDEQLPDSLLAALTADLGSGPVTLPMPGLKRVIYFVADDVDFGQQPVPPTLKFEYECQRPALGGLGTHQIGQDAVIPEVLYDILTNPFYGAGAGQVNAESFKAAAEVIVAEGLGASPYLDRTTTIREFIGVLLQYIDGCLCWESGEVHLRLIRHESPDEVPVIDESVLASEPKPRNEGWGDTWNYTRLVYTDADNGWENDAVEVWDDPANAAVVGVSVPREIPLPFVTTREVAKSLARRKGLAGAMPPMAWELEVLPVLRSLKPGDLADFTFTRRGVVNRRVRVMEVGRSGRDNQVVRLIVRDELLRTEENSYVPPDEDHLGLSPYLDESGQAAFRLAGTQPRLATLSTGLLDGAADGLLVVAHRPTALADGFKVFFTWDPMQKAYAEIDAADSWPLKAETIWWTRTRFNTAFIFRLKFASASEAQIFTTFAQSAEGTHIVVARRLVKTVGSTQDEHQTDAMWLTAQPDGYLQPISSTEIEIEATGAAFGCAPPEHETAAAPGNYPSLHAYAGRRADFLVHRSDSLMFARPDGNGPPIGSPDTDLRRWIKTPTFTWNAEQILADAGGVVYDRDDPAMCPDGTYDVDWGPSVPSLAEMYDRAGGASVFGGVHPGQALTADVDAALYHRLWGFADADQELLSADTDQVLGFMTATSSRIYNKTL